MPLSRPSHPTRIAVVESCSRSAAASCSQNSPEYGARILCRSIDGFGQGEAVGVIGKPDRPGAGSVRGGGEALLRCTTTGLTQEKDL
jgi:hypothetical protein